ncbi:hypothetical protein HPP92_002524, partial [Vanilla planifolia]
KFDADTARQPSSSSEEGVSEQWQQLEEDSDLPSDLEGAIRQSSQASASFIASGGMKAIVELLIPQLQFLDAEGAQGELWELSRVFLESLKELIGIQKLRAIFPDAGAAALLKHQWGDANFGFASLSDRKPVGEDDEVIVMIVPDYQMLEYVERIASQLSDFPPRPLIMWNPRLVSEDVGVGFNVLESLYDDPNRPNRYLLAKEQPSRPDSTDIEEIFATLTGKSEEAPSLLSRAFGVFNS